ncbi:Uu.00g125170.m01.CDS01 [Anthostomella pinea]|uniref:Uu.00g125170.m01.CDS01 n=1 Tax=Anthostomella pinea TaxID=933095 RepID=A0AAI8VHM7_9PEZI|nr:Uu.00g125170.m01.CDS01 [Anthostomella pinea]
MAFCEAAGRSDILLEVRLFGLERQRCITVDTEDDAAIERLLRRLGNDYDSACLDIVAVGLRGLGKLNVTGPEMIAWVKDKYVSDDRPGRPNLAVILEDMPIFRSVALLFRERWGEQEM